MALSVRLGLIFAGFSLLFAVLAFFQLSSIDETARSLRLQRQWEEVRPAVMVDAAGRVGPVAEFDRRSEYEGHGAHRFFAVWAGYDLIATSSDATAALVRAVSGASSIHIGESSSFGGSDGTIYFLSRRIGGSAILTVGHLAWSSDDLLREVEYLLLRQTALIAIALGGCVLVISGLVVKRHFAPLRVFIAHMASVGRPGAAMPILPTAGPIELALLISETAAAVNRLERKVADEQRYVADAAHHLLTPLGLLSARLDLGEGLADTRSSIERMTRRVHQMMSFARSTRDPDCTEPVDLGLLARDVVSEIAPLFVAQGKEISLVSPPDVVLTSCDALAVAEALSNLLLNALDVTRVGGCVEVQVDARPAICVLDRGPGWAPGYEARIFEPYFTTRRSAGGTGLGLAIVARIMASHNGRVEAGLRAGGGAVLQLVFSSREGVI